MSPHLNTTTMPFSGKNLLKLLVVFKMAYSSADPSAPTILRPQVRIQSTIMLLSWSLCCQGYKRMWVHWDGNPGGKKGELWSPGLAPIFEKWPILDVLVKGEIYIF